ncbi:MAG TPA: hypothetical protein VK978_04805, partial [Candidatus Saccharimonadales bacterium]|nr:hypothetical protein [Candidatus Saccharimonadales bacterium]
DDDGLDGLFGSSSTEDDNAAGNQPIVDAVVLDRTNNQPPDNASVPPAPAGASASHAHLVRRPTLSGRMAKLRERLNDF